MDIEIIQSSININYSTLSIIITYQILKLSNYTKL